MTTSHVLRLNDLLLSTGEDAPPTGDEAGRWWWDVYGSDLTTGAAESIETTMRTLLQDGARVVTTGYGVREVSFYAVVGGVNSGALAEAERTLALHLGRRGELGWTPPDGWGPETVFDVETSSMEAGGPEDDDLIEVQNTERVYRLRFVCQPFVRPATKTVVPALSAPSVPQNEDVLDDGTTIGARWTAVSGTLTDGGSYLQMSGLAPRLIVGWTPASPTSIATQPYISLVADTLVYCLINGKPTDLVSSSASSITTSGGVIAATRYVWQTSESTINSLVFGNPTGFRFRDLRVSNLPSSSGTPRQSLRTIEVGGSVRTQGAVKVKGTEEKGLGDVIFYTATASTPIAALSEYAIGVTTAVADVDAVSGYSRNLIDDPDFDIPVGAFAAGKHQILARLRFTGGGTPVPRDVVWSAQVFVGSSAIGPAVVGTARPTLDAGWSVVHIATVDLPTVDLPATSTAKVRIVLDTVHAIQYDEVWAFNLDVGALTIVNAGDHKILWIETPTLDRPRPAVYLGDSDDQSDAFHDPTAMMAWGSHEFAPPITTVAIVTTDTGNPDVTFEYFPLDFNFVAG